MTTQTDPVSPSPLCPPTVNLERARQPESGLQSRRAVTTTVKSTQCNLYVEFPSQVPASPWDPVRIAACRKKQSRYNRTDGPGVSQIARTTRTTTSCGIQTILKRTDLEVLVRSKSEPKKAKRVSSTGVQCGRPWEVRHKVVQTCRMQLDKGVQVSIAVEETGKSVNTPGGVKGAANKQKARAGAAGVTSQPTVYPGVCLREAVNILQSVEEFRRLRAEVRVIQGVTQLELTRPDGFGFLGHPVHTVQLILREDGVYHFIVPFLPIQTAALVGDDLRFQSASFCELVRTVSSPKYRLCPGLGLERFSEHTWTKNLQVINAPFKRLQSSKCPVWFTSEDSSRTCDACKQLKKSMRAVELRERNLSPTEKHRRTLASSSYPISRLSPTSRAKRIANMRNERNRFKKAKRQDHSQTEEGLEGSEDLDMNGDDLDCFDGNSTDSNAEQSNSQTRPPEQASSNTLQRKRRFSEDRSAMASSYGKQPRLEYSREMNRLEVSARLEQPLGVDVHFGNLDQPLKMECSPGILVEAKPEVQGDAVWTQASHQTNGSFDEEFDVKPQTSELMKQSLELARTQSLQEGGGWRQEHTNTLQTLDRKQGWPVVIIANERGSPQLQEEDLD
ncbi:hypothetical protein BaRGS_00001580 [Batillaria attramentaria]|uniref:Uncharacterized protein n=1 Tax=Batillaria attramentaria TaxID=370345 RepID=A0ABD0M7Z1_9CAEN